MLPQFYNISGTLRKIFSLGKSKERVSLINSEGILYGTEQAGAEYPLIKPYSEVFKLCGFLDRQSSELVIEGNKIVLLPSQGNSSFIVYVNSVRKTLTGVSAEINNTSNSNLLVYFNNEGEFKVSETPDDIATRVAWLVRAVVKGKLEYLIYDLRLPPNSEDYLEIEGMDLTCTKDTDIDYGTNINISKGRVLRTGLDYDIVSMSQYTKLPVVSMSNLPMFYDSTYIFRHKGKFIYSFNGKDITPEDNSYLNYYIVVADFMGMTKVLSLEPNVCYKTLREAVDVDDSNSINIFGEHVKVKPLYRITIHTHSKFNKVSGNSKIVDVVDLRQQKRILPTFVDSTKININTFVEHKTTKFIQAKVNSPILDFEYTSKSNEILSVQLSADIVGGVVDSKIDFVVAKNGEVVARHTQLSNPIPEDTSINLTKIVQVNRGDKITFKVYNGTSVETRLDLSSTISSIGGVL